MQLYGLDYLVNEHQRIFWLYLASSALIASLYLWFNPAYRKGALSGALWWHASARLDYLYFFVSALIKIFVLVPLLLGTEEVALAVVSWLQEHFGYVTPLRWEKSTIVAFYTFALFLASDFTRYWLHRLMHEIPPLWRFHRVHHSAEVLTPITFYRVHPVENLIFGLRYALSAGTVTGLFVYFFGARLGGVEFFGVNLFVFLFSLLGANLRHSHLPVRFGKALEKWVVSPYMHQYHHSVEGSRKNYGGALSLWDRLFGTLHIEKGRELTFGINEKGVHHSIMALLFEPFKTMIKG
jgi:sterol desaturase/sphingolipid hydroxylase (fatty acid hydroxylase superfamily)